MIRGERRHGERRSVRRYRWVSRRVAVTQAQRSTRAASRRCRSKQGCRSIIRGRRYRAIFQAAAPAIRRADPGAQILAGETSPIAGLDLFAGAGRCRSTRTAGRIIPTSGTSRPSGPTGGFGIGDTARVAALVGMPLYYTEFGYPRPGSDWEHAALRR